MSQGPYKPGGDIGKSLGWSPSLGSQAPKLKKKTKKKNNTNKKKIQPPPPHPPPPPKKKEQKVESK